MKRDTAREMAVQAVFAAPASGLNSEEFLTDFFSEEHFPSLRDEGELYAQQPDSTAMEYISNTVSGVFAHLEELDSLIEKYARGWSVSRISATARAVLRVAVYEMLYAEDVPVASAINSAVEIDKNYDDADTVAFVNGVLGAITRGADTRPENEAKTEPATETEPKLSAETESETAQVSAE